MKKAMVVAKFIISRSAFCNGFEGFLGFSVPSIILVVSLAAVAVVFSCVMILKTAARETIILADLLRNTCLLVRVQKVMVCDT